MAVKTILAYLPSTNLVEGVIDAALSIGGPTGAHIVGMHIIATVPIYTEYPVLITPEVFNEINRPRQEAAQAVRAAFEKRIKTSLLSREWTQLTGEMSQTADFVVARARVCDLTICPNFTGDEWGNQRDILERVVMETGRPVLILPKLGGRFAGEQILVAWNDTREATRAIFDALDIFKAASAVRVVRLVSAEEELPGAENATKQLVAMLVRHGVHAAAEVSLIGSGLVSDKLITRMLDMNCSLLVMGCYGHSRLRETIFGGVTRKALDEFWIPLLMSR